MLNNYDIPFDILRFERACSTVLSIQENVGFTEKISGLKGKKPASRSISREGYTNIGGLSESSLHLILKYYIEENSDFHEVGYDDFQLDVCRDSNMIYEIQTSNFNSIRKKLSLLLPKRAVRIVFPIISKKRIFWTDPDSGETLSGRISPKKENQLTLLSELIYILPLLKEKLLSFCLIDLHCNDYKVLCGWSKDRKKGSVRYNRVPTKLISVYNYSSCEEYLSSILPSFSIDSIITSKSLSQESGLSQDQARIALKILSELGFVKRDGKQGRFIKYNAIKSFKGQGNI